eukprot:SAG31_NODE_9567_length_1258_cov_1.289905_3_plen_68_part_00
MQERAPWTPNMSTENWSLEKDPPSVASEERGDVMMTASAEGDIAAWSTVLSAGQVRGYFLVFVPTIR